MHFRGVNAGNSALILFPPVRAKEELFNRLKKYSFPLYFTYKI